MIGKAKIFLKDVRVELSKVAWPTRDELVGSTTVVIVSVIILAVFIGFCDFIFSKAIHFVIK